MQACPQPFDIHIHWPRQSSTPRVPGFAGGGRDVSPSVTHTAAVLLTAFYENRSDLTASSAINGGKTKSKGRFDAEYGRYKNIKRQNSTNPFLLRTLIIFHRKGNLF